MPLRLCARAGTAPRPPSGRTIWRKAAPAARRWSRRSRRFPARGSRSCSFQVSRSALTSTCGRPSAEPGSPRPTAFPDRCEQCASFSASFVERGDQRRARGAEQRFAFLQQRFFAFFERFAFGGNGRGCFEGAARLAHEQNLVRAAPFGGHGPRQHAGSPRGHLAGERALLGLEAHRAAPGRATSRLRAWCSGRAPSVAPALPTPHVSFVQALPSSGSRRSSSRRSPGPRRPSAASVLPRTVARRRARSRRVRAGPRQRERASASAPQREHARAQRPPSRRAASARARGASRQRSRLRERRRVRQHEQAGCLDRVFAPAPRVEAMGSWASAWVCRSSLVGQRRRSRRSSSLRLPGRKGAHRGAGHDALAPLGDQAHARLHREMEAQFERVAVHERLCRCESSGSGDPRFGRRAPRFPASELPRRAVLPRSPSRRAGGRRGRPAAGPGQAAGR